MARMRSNSLDAVCFLIEAGYDDLYEVIYEALDNEDEYKLNMPQWVMARVEQSYMRLVTLRSNDTVLTDKTKRGKPKDMDAREKEIEENFPIIHISNKMIKETPKCVICQEEMKLREHVRNLHHHCTFHRRCIDSYLKEAQDCPVCKSTVLKS